MRTLSRPMFNMGGPIKQGIMHGIREPHKDGKIVGGHQSPLLAGAHPWKDKSGREHHVLPAVWAGAAGFARFAPALYRALSAGKNIKNVAGAANIAKNVGTTGVTAAAPTGFKGYLMRDPLVKSALWAKDALFNPTTAGWGKSALRFATAPSSLLTAGYFGGRHLLKDKPIDPVTGVEKPGGFPGAVGEEKKIKVLSDTERKAFANKQREERVQKYMDMMGYDRSKRTAIADALIDASKIVGDRGTLDLKNISRDLINPIIQATSKRLDKPDQIREAVGLMATKAEIEKDLSKETDALAKEKTVKQIEVLDRQLEQGFESDIRNLLLTARTPPNKAQLEQYARLTADKYGETFTKVEGEGDIAGDGIYMVEGTLVRVTDGKPKRIV